MPTILRSSAVGKLRDGSTTTVPSPRSSGSLAGYRAAKVRWSSSNGTIGGANDIVKDNQSSVMRTPPILPDRHVLRDRPAAQPAPPQDRHHGGYAPGHHLLRRRRRRADLPPAGRRLLPPRGRRPGPAASVPRGGPVGGRGAAAAVPHAVL